MKYINCKTDCFDYVSKLKIDDKKAVIHTSAPFKIYEH